MKLFVNGPEINAKMRLILLPQALKLSVYFSHALVMRILPDDVFDLIFSLTQCAVVWVQGVGLLMIVSMGLTVRLGNLVWTGHNKSTYFGRCRATADRVITMIAQSYGRVVA